MLHPGPIKAAAPPHRTLVDREDHRVALSQGHDRCPRLPPGPLLGQQEFAALEILARPREQDRDLQRKGFRAVEVLMEAIVSAGAIAKEQRRGPSLACGSATLQIVRVE